MWIKKFGIAHRNLCGSAGGDLASEFGGDLAFVTKYQMLTKVYRKIETIVATTTQNS